MDESSKRKRRRKAKQALEELEFNNHVSFLIESSSENSGSLEQHNPRSRRSPRKFQCENVHYLNHKTAHGLEELSSLLYNGDDFEEEVYLTKRQKSNYQIGIDENASTSRKDSTYESSDDDSGKPVKVVKTTGCGNFEEIPIIRNQMSNDGISAALDHRDEIKRLDFPVEGGDKCDSNCPSNSTEQQEMGIDNAEILPKNDEPTGVIENSLLENDLRRKTALIPSILCPAPIKEKSIITDKYQKNALLNTSSDANKGCGLDLYPISSAGSSKSQEASDSLGQTSYHGIPTEGSQANCEIESLGYSDEEGLSGDSEFESVSDLEIELEDFEIEAPPEGNNNNVPAPEVPPTDNYFCDIGSGGEPPSLKQDLALWAVKNAATHASVDGLLEILRKHGHIDLPKNAKTLLKTPRNTSTMIKRLCGGDYWYGGIMEGIKRRLSVDDLQKLQGKTVSLNVFVDGLSPYKCVKKHLCAILGCITGISSEIFEIALWSGDIHEPDDVDSFFEDFIGEARSLKDNGFVIEGISGRISFKIDKYIADALARAWMLRNVIPPHAFYCCERCTVKGYRLFSRTLFDPDDEATLRTDESLLNQTQKEHHSGVSPLIKLVLKPLSDCPIEPMHNVYLGVFRRFFSMLLSSKKGISKMTLKKPVIEKLSSYLMSLKPYYPSEFNRKIRPLVEYTNYKATEFRRLGLYDAYLLLRQLECKQIADVHSLFGCAIRILSDKALLRFRSDADRMLRTFVKQSTKLFGDLFPTFNVHCLIHLADETARHGTLDDFSSWNFETYLGHIKEMLRAPGRTLTQIVCRINEMIAVIPERPTRVENAVCVSQPHNRGPVLQTSHDLEQFQRLSVSNCLIRVNSCNDVCFLSKSDDVCVVNNIRVAGEVSVVCTTFTEVADFFKYPIRSTVLNICTVKSLGPLICLPVSEIKRKVVLLPLKENDREKAPTSSWMNNVECLCLPMLHSSDGV